MNSAASSSLNNICYEQISENFHYGIFGDFHLVIDKDTGCFNATKLCAMADKNFFNWKRLAGTKRLISYLEEQQPSSSKEIIYEVRTGTNNINITGYYVQKELILDIASWISPDFYFRCNNIVINYFTEEYKGLGEAEKNVKFKDFKTKMKSIIREKDVLIDEQKDKIDLLFEKLAASEKERKAVEEARKADVKAAEEVARKTELLLEKAEEERKADRLLLRSMGINLLDVKNQNIELLEEVQDTNTKLTTVQKKLNIAVEDRAPLPSQNRKKERFILLKRNDEEDFPYYAVRGQHYYVQTVLKNQRQLFGEIEILLDFHCHPNSKTLFVRIRDSLKRKGVEFSSCKISIRDSTTVSEGELIETMKQINDEKLNV
jgi:hypothetical protein